MACALIGCAAIPSCLQALDPSKGLHQFNCQSWTQEAGLPANKITSITQTKDGFLWLGTQNGLVRFDGLEFGLVPLALPKVETQEVRKLSRSARGGLWFATNNGGFGYFDGRAFSAIPDARWNQPSVVSTAVVEARDGSVWTGMQPGWGHWVPGKADDSTIEGLTGKENVLALCEDPLGRIWRGMSERGLFWFANGKWNQIPDESLKRHNIFALAGDVSGQIWVGTEVGLRCYDAAGNPKEIAPLVGDVKAILIDSHGILWVGVNGGGVARFKDGAWTYLKKEDGLVSDYVTALYEDAEGSIWVGTRDGLSQIADLKFPIFTGKDGFPSGPSHAVALSRDGGIWVFSYGLCHYDGKTPRVYGDELGNINHYLINGLEARNGDLYLIDGDKNLVVFSHEKVVLKLPIAIWPRALVEDDHGVLLAVGDTLYRIVEGKLVPYEFADGAKREFFWINNLSLARDGAIWIACNNGIFRVKDGASQRWGTEDGLPGIKANWAKEDADGSVWVGLTSGMARIKDGHAVKITQENGIFDNRVYSIIPDDNGYFWISSGRGIFRVTREQLNDFADGKAASVSCDIYDGRESVRFSDRTDEEASGCKTPDGRIWFPNAQGVVMIEPKNFYRNTLPPPVHLQSVVVDGVEARPRAGLRLAPGDRRIVFTFAALSFISPKKVKVRYQLKGADAEWVDAGQRRSVSYTHLRPGKYEFQVQACNADGVWNLEGDAVYFEQLPQFYETGWFILLCSMGGVAVLLGAYRWKVRHMEARQKKLQAENDLLEGKVAARTAELAREHALLRALLDHSPDQIYFKDAQSRYLKASKALADAIGAKSPEELIGKSDSDFFSPEHARPALEDEHRIMSTGEPIVGKVEKETWANGRVSWVLTTKMPLRNGAGEIVGTFGTSKSITAIKEAEAKLEQVHNELLETSRKAGMAEVATSVLHNVGNVLNSVNVSATVARDRIHGSKVTNFVKVSSLLSEHQAELARFLTEDPRGQKLPEYVQTLAQSVLAEQRVVVEELDSLCKNVEHIKEIVATQQAYARVSGVTETVPAVDLVEEALRMHTASFSRHDITIVRAYAFRTLITVQRHKVLQILVNLLANAKDACGGSDAKEKIITVATSQAAGRLRIEVRDNGVGISAENLTRIFAHGFTTRSDGHGFGLHSGALGAKELGGSLIAQSDGLGKGAIFILDLPLQPETTGAAAS